MWKGDSGLTEGTKRYARGEKSTISQVYTGPHATAVAALPWPGALGTGDWANWRVVSAVVEEAGPGTGRLVIQWEPANGSAGATLPLTSLRMASQPKVVHLIRAPRYAVLRTEAFARALAMFESRSRTEDELAYWRDQIISIGNGLSTELGTELGTEFAAKLDANIWEYEQPIWRIEIEAHSWAFPSLSEGGTVSTSGPALPDSGSWPSGMRFRRLADTLAYNGSFYTLTQTWLAGVQGTLDSDLGV